MKNFCVRLSFVLVVSLFIIYGSVQSTVFAQVTDIQDNELMKKGIYQFRQENYEEALNTFTKVKKERGMTSLNEYYIGLTYKRMEDYVNAKDHLEASLTLHPKIKGALMELVDLLYRLEEYNEAEKWITVAEEEGVRPAQTKFLKGLTLQKTGEYMEAINAFKDAKDLDDKLTQSADYQIGICYLKMRRFKDAKAVFSDVFAYDPYSDVAEYADRYVDAIDSKLEKQRPFGFSIKAGFEYDSNVLLNPITGATVTGITDSDDTRQVFDGSCDYTFRNEDNSMSLKAGYSFHLAKQNDFGNYDIVGNNLSAQGNITYNNMLFTFPFNYNHTTVAEKNYLQSFTGGEITSFMPFESTMAQVGLIYTYSEYMRPASLPGESRTGDQIDALAAWYWFFLGNKGYVNLKYDLIKNWPNGGNWEFLGNKISAGVLYPFFEKFKYNLSGSVYFQSYDNVNTIFAKKRKDQTYTISNSLTYEIVKNVELQLKYSFVKEQSNVTVYKYDRHVVGAACEYKY